MDGCAAHGCTAMEQRPNQETTRLLAELADGDRAAAERLLPLVYDELRSLAARCMRGQPADHTWQPTALVHEAFLRLSGAEPCANRHHFLALAAKAMRQLLVDHARRRSADKRGGGRQRVTLAGIGEKTTPAVDALALDEALRQLARLHPRQAQIIELRFFGGLTIAETARALELGTTTVEDDFVMARAWLARELADA